MIRLCDKNVWIAEQCELSSQFLCDYFKEYASNVLMVTDRGKAKGYLTYQSIISVGVDNWKQCIVNEYVTAGADMWDQAKEIFRKHPNLKYVPVYNQNNELSYFCYDSYPQKESYQYIGQILKILSSSPQLLKWQETFPGIESVEIYDMNEFSYYLAEILELKGIDVVLHGEKWKLFSRKVDSVQTHMDSTIMRLYAEGTEMFPQSREKCDLTLSFGFLIALMRKEVRLLEKKMQKEWDNFFICRFPIYSELSYRTDEEDYMTRFVGGADGRELTDSMQKQFFVRVNGMEPEEYYKKKEWESDHLIPGLTEYYGGVRIIRSSKGKNTVWLLGPCIVEGFGVLYHDYLCCCIDRYLKEQGMEEYGVCSVSYLFYELDTLQKAITSLPVRKKDVVICIGEDISWGQQIGEKPDLKLDALFAQREREPWFYNVPIHTNARGNERIAKEISEKLILPYIRRSQNVSDEYLAENCLSAVSPKDKIADYETEVVKYVDKLNEVYHILEFLGNSRRIGAIVMNCNPFTLGHRYLIEESAKKVQKLIIFVVEENRSCFDFKDRFQMVREGTRDLRNVIAVPSGNFVLSYHTLPAYFRKEENRQVMMDASLDLNIFSSYIAPKLGITIRFAGEEPIDPVTAQYNRQMRERFSKEGRIEFSEIPRKELEGKAISASLVRKELENGNWEKIRMMVPATTYEFLKSDGAVRG